MIKTHADPWYMCHHAKVTEAFGLEQISLKSKLIIKILVLFKELVMCNSSTCFLYLIARDLSEVKGIYSSLHYSSHAGELRPMLGWSL